METAALINRHRLAAAALACVVFSCAALPLLTHAQTDTGLTVTPVVIDEKGKARDIINESITLTNTTAHDIELYPSVNDVNDETGEQAFQYAQNSTGLAASLSNWIELTRGVIDLSAGQQLVVPFTITINENAVANMYHAVITFNEGTTRDEAEATAPLASVAVNLEVDADIKQALQLDKFTSPNIVFTGDDVLFNYNLENIGNQDLAPTGEIDIYDRNGEEVATVDVNKAGTSISPNQTAQLASVWSAANGFGKFKALITVNYGSQDAAVQDTVFFWVVPWVQILEILAASVVAIVILGLYFHRWLEMRHLNKLAAAGALKPGVLEQIQNTPPPPIIPLPPMPSMPELPALPTVAEVKEMKDRMQAQVRHKRTLFTLFKRQGFVSMPEPLAKSISVYAPPAPEPAARPQGGTIDLKQMSKRPPEAPPAESHIINLRKPQ